MAPLLPNDPVFFRLRGPVLPPGEEAEQMLGRVVRNFAQPLGGGYSPEDGGGFAIGPPIKTKWLRASEVFSRSTSGHIELRLPAAAGRATAQLEGAQNFSLTNSEVLAIELRHQPEVFRKLLADAETGAWIRANCKLNHPLYMVTGLLVWRDAVQEESTEQRVAGDGNLNVGAVAAAAATVATGGAAAPFAALAGGGRVGGGGEKVEKREQKKESGDSQVFAIEYKVVRRRKRNVVGGFAPALKGYGPAIDADRQYSSPGSGTAADIESSAEAEEQDLPELAVDLAWVDVAEELAGDDAELLTDKVEAGGRHVEFADFEAED